MFEIGQRYSGDMNGEVFTVSDIKKAEKTSAIMIVFQSEKTGKKYEISESHAAHLMLTKYKGAKHDRLDKHKRQTSRKVR